VAALARSVSELDNSEMDFRMALLHGPLEHFSDEFGAKLAYGDLLLLRRHVHYLALGGCGTQYDSEGWVYNPGPGGFYHVMVDTAVEPKHIARYVAYPATLNVSRPPAAVQRPRREERERRIFDELAAAGA